MKKYKPIDSLKSPRFCGIRTFMRLPHVPIAEEADFAVIGVPFDTGVTFFLMPELYAETYAALGEIERAIELDPAWEPAQAALQRVRGTITQMEFDLRMTEGLTALAEGDYLGARAAFRMAEKLKPGSPEPADGLLQVDQGIRLQEIAALEHKAQQYEQAEEWSDAKATYERILELEPEMIKIDRRIVQGCDGDEVLRGEIVGLLGHEINLYSVWYELRWGITNAFVLRIQTLMLPIRILMFPNS